MTKTAAMLRSLEVVLEELREMREILRDSHEEFGVDGRAELQRRVIELAGQAQEMFDANRGHAREGGDVKSEAVSHGSH